MTHRPTALPAFQNIDDLSVLPFPRENHDIKFTPQYFGTVSSSIQHTLDVQWMLSSHEQGSGLQAIADCIHYRSQWQDGLPLTNILFRDSMEISTFHGSFSLPQSVFISIDGPCIFYSWLQSWLPTGFTTSIYDLVNILLTRNSDHWRILFQTMKPLASTDEYVCYPLWRLIPTQPCNEPSGSTYHSILCTLSNAWFTITFRLQYHHWSHDHIASSMIVVQSLGVTWH